MRRERQRLHGNWIVIVIAAVALAACASLPRLDAVPADHVGGAEVAGLPGVRYIVGGDQALLSSDILAVRRRERAWLASSGYDFDVEQPILPPHHYLAISGGGDNGAFAAGLLVGWSALGTRPKFDVVTGVSTGALIAPFAFLGQPYDAEMQHEYTSITPEGIFVLRGFFKRFTSESLTKSDPLKELVERSVTPQMLQEIGAEHQKGRLLMVATTDMDSGRAVVWNMTKVAAIGTEEALDLFRSILIASSAVPGVFPPVMMDVVADGQEFQEMHADGGTAAQTFLYPPAFRQAVDVSVAIPVRDRHLYIIRNSSMRLETATTKRSTVQILIKAAGTLVRYQGIGDLYRIYVTSLRDNVGYNLAHIPDEFDEPHPEEFNQVYMQALFDFAHEKAIQGYPWLKYPPGYDPGLPDEAVSGAK